MTFEVGRLSAALTLDGVPEFHRELQGAGDALQRTGQQGASFGKAAEATVRAAAGVTTGLVTTAGAYLTILTKTGVAYNSVQQNTRAALSVVLGGATAANEQMAKLDDFARNSPFSKSVFINAQQQLLGFGVEAGKVLPTLDAIQQTVAAFGGNADQITAITDVLARLQSQGSLGGEALERLGYYGVDAAKIIGEQMGLTGAQIKEMAGKPGGIPVEQIWDPLVNGLQQNFGGAADNVKMQWSGAVDRIMAAQRDLGSHLAEPFVSAQGGGMAVTWGNQVADVLRAIEKQSIPVIGMLTQRSMPFFASITESLDKAQQSVQRWDASKLDVSLDKLAGHAPGVAALAGATLALGAQVGPLGKMLGALHLTINPVVAALIGLAAASPEVRASLSGVLEAGKPLIGVTGELAKMLSGQLNAALPLVSGSIDIFASVLGFAVGLLEKIPTPVLAGAAAFLLMHKASAGMQGPLQDAAKWLDAVRAEGTIMGGVLDAAGTKATSLGATMKAAFLSNPIGIALTAVSIAVGAWAMANAEAQQKVQEHQARTAELRGTLDQTTGSLTDASRAMVAESVAAEDMADKLKAADVSGQAFTRGLIDGGAAATYFRGELVESAKASTEAQAQIDAARDMSERLGLSYDTVVASLIGFGDATEEVDAAVRASGPAYSDNAIALQNLEGLWKGNAGAQRAVVEAYELQRTAIEAAQAEQTRMNQALADAQHAMTDTARSNERFNDALAAARDTTQDAETRVRALKQALDELKGGTLSAEEAELRLNETALNLADGLARADESGTKLWQSTLDGAGKIDSSTRSGQDFARTMLSSNDAMLAAAVAAHAKAIADGDAEGAAKAATDAAQGYVDTLREQLTAAGLNEEQIAGLIKQYADVPSVVATLLTDNGSFSELGQQVLDIASELAALPEGTSITVDNPGGQEAIDAFRELGYAVQENPDTKQITVTALGVEETTLAFERIAGTVVPEKILKITPDAAAAFEGIDGVNVKQVDKKTAYVYGDNADALTKIQAVVDRGMPGKKTWISGDDSGFQSVWNRINNLANLRKTVEIITNNLKGNFDGGMYTSGGKHFAQGGFASGIYKGVTGGIPKRGIDGGMHIFAEKEMGVDWEAYISSRSSARPRNIAIAMDALNRLGFPVVPAAALRGVTAFANGGMVGRSSQQVTSPSPSIRVNRRDGRARAGKLADVINVGVDASRNDVRELAGMLDRIDREG